MKVGILGSGFMATSHAKAWQKTKATLCGFASSCMASAQKAALQFGVQPYPTMQALIEACDIVDITTPTHLHHSQVLAVANAGKHVICEKPLALTAAKAQQMLEVCAKNKVLLLPAHVLRYYPEYHKAHQLLTLGEVGEVSTLSFERLSYKPLRHESNWLFNENKSGGIILDLMIHDIDMAIHFAGPVRRVLASKTSLNKYVSVYDYAVALLTHESGALSRVVASWIHPKGYFRTSFQICGQKGSISYDSEQSKSIHRFWIKDGTGSTGCSFAEPSPTGLPSSLDNENPHDIQIADMYRCITRGEKTRIEAEEAVAAVIVAEAALTSATSGQVVPCNYW